MNQPGYLSIPCRSFFVRHGIGGLVDAFPEGDVIGLFLE